MSEPLLTVEQAADRLHLRASTIRRQLRDGALRGVKRGHVWRVPESALYVSSVRAASTLESADRLWQDISTGDDEKRSAALKALATAPEAVRDIVLQLSGEVATRFYASPAGQAEWEEQADWRALDSEPFHGFEEDDNEA